MIGVEPSSHLNPAGWCEIVTSGLASGHLVDVLNVLMFCFTIKKHHEGIKPTIDTVS